MTQSHCNSASINQEDKFLVISMALTDHREVQLDVSRRRVPVVDAAAVHVLILKAEKMRSLFKKAKSGCFSDSSWGMTRTEGGAFIFFPFAQARPLTCQKIN